jgi:membrane-bound ClpP family serine protease
MFELSASPIRPKRSFLSWVGAACVLTALYFTLSADGYSPIAMLLIIAGNILVMVDARQKKEPQLPHLLPQ